MINPPYDYSNLFTNYSKTIKANFYPITPKSYQKPPYTFSSSLHYDYFKVPNFPSA